MQLYKKNRQLYYFVSSNESCEENKNNMNEFLCDKKETYK